MFRALDDPSRRQLLDALFEQDGRSLQALCALLPAMSRYGVMKHLRVLERAGLVTTRRSGRRTLHYLNPVPIRRVHDRWISKFTEPLVGALAALTQELEGAAMQPSHVYRTYIACTPDAAWRAITDGRMTSRYFYATTVHSGWKVGDAIVYRGADGSIVADGAVLAIEPGARLEMTFHAHWDTELEAEGPVRMAWVVEAAGELTRVTVEYYELDGRREGAFMDGIPMIVAGMKTLLETGSEISAVAAAVDGQAGA